MSFTDLPLDVFDGVLRHASILHDILECIADCIDQLPIKDLSSLSKVSRALHPATLPRLYASVTVGWSRHDVATDSLNSGDPERLQYVRELRVTHGDVGECELFRDPLIGQIPDTSFDPVRRCSDSDSDRATYGLIQLIEKFRVDQLRGFW
jgi:hypothetical protein